MIILSSLIWLSACSLLEGVNNTVDYVNTTTGHIEKLSNFSEEAPQLFQEAVNDPAVREELESQLVTLKGDIETFINMEEIPAIAEGIHQELVDKNKVLLEEINKLVDNGNLVIDQIQNSQIIRTINEVTQLLNRIENLGG